MKREDIIAAARAYRSMYLGFEQKWLSGAPQECLTCKLGCNHCCYQLVLGTLITGVLIADELLKRQDIELLSKIEMHGDHCCMLMDKLGDRAPGFHLDLHKPCPLLGKDGQCKLYEHRPPACSTYYIQGGEAVCASAKSDTRVASADNMQIQLIAHQHDSMFLSVVLGDESWKDELILGPLGMMVKAGRALLEDKDRFLSYVESWNPERLFSK